MSQKEVTIAMMVNIPDTSHPTSCAAMGEGKQFDDEDSCDSETGQLRTLKYNIAVLKQRRALLGCLWRKTSRIFRHYVINKRKSGEVREACARIAKEIVKPVVVGR
jgi:hypothetical protein